MFPPPPRLVSQAMPVHRIVRPALSAPPPSSSSSSSSSPPGYRRWVQTYHPVRARIPTRGGPHRSSLYRSSLTPLRAPAPASPPASPSAAAAGKAWVRVPLSERDQDLARLAAHMPVEEVALPVQQGPRAGPSANAPLGAVRTVPFAHIAGTPHPKPSEFGYAPPPLVRPIALALVAATLSIAYAAWHSVESSAALARALRSEERENSTGGKLKLLLKGLGDLTSFSPSTSSPDSPPSDALGHDAPSPSASFRRDGDAWAADPLDDPLLGVGEARLRSANTHVSAAKLGGTLQTFIAEGKDVLPSSWMQTIVQSYLRVSEAYLSLSPGHAAMVPPLLVAALVHLPFKAAPMKARLGLMEVLAHAPGARTLPFFPRPPVYWTWMKEKAYELAGKVPRLHTILTSGWTHISTLHLLANGIAIYSIGSVAVERLTRPGDGHLDLLQPRGKDRVAHTSTPHVPEASLVPVSFAILFAGAAVGGAVGHTVSALRARSTLARLLRQWGRPSSRASGGDRLSHQLMQDYSDHLVRPSVGLSAGAYSLLMLLTLEMPDAEVIGPLTLFMPQSIATATSVLLLVDCTGLVLGWKALGHAAHLGGAAFGCFWFYYGQDMFEQLKAFFARRLAKEQLVRVRV